MISAPPKMQELLQAYGIEQHMMAYFNREEPNRLYVTAYGQLHFIDLSMINVMNGAIVQNLALKACELVRNDPTVRSDLENELNKVIQRVLSKLAEKRSKNDVTLATESLKCTSTSNWQMLTDSEREALQRERRKRNAYKTSLCRSFRENNICPYGEECVFAHGEKELRLPPQAHPKYKTQLCNKFSIWNYCPYGARCQYIHQRINEISRMDANLNAKENSEDNLEKNFSPVTLQHPSKRLILRRANKSTECISSPIALGNHSSFVERGGFTSSLTSTDFNCDENRKQSLESSDLFDPDYPNYDNNEFHLNTEAVTNNIILNQLHEHFNNMKIEDNNNLFSRSCFSRIGSGQVE
ncbi:Zinc finger C-x8-C-x5-C-x3-H type (and similar) family protein [Acanthocheilonema viteae]